MIQPEQDCFCHHCGYNLRGLPLEPESTCPECGKAVAEAIDPTRFVPIRDSANWMALYPGAQALMISAAFGFFIPLAIFFHDTMIMIRDDDFSLHAITIWLLIDSLCVLLAARYWACATSRGTASLYRGMSGKLQASRASVVALADLTHAAVVEGYSAGYFTGETALWAALLFWLVARMSWTAPLMKWSRMLALDVGLIDLGRQVRRLRWSWMMTLRLLIVAVVLYWSRSIWIGWMPHGTRLSKTYELIPASGLAAGGVLLWMCFFESARVFNALSIHLRKPQP